MVLSVAANLTVLDAVSRQIVPQQFYPMCLNIAVVLISVVGNCSVLLTIVSTKTLRSGTFRILGSLALTEVMYSVSQLYLNSYGVYMSYNSLSAVEPQQTCVERIFATNALSLCSQILTTVVAFDRFYAIVFPVRYRSLINRIKFRYVTGVCYTLGFFVTSPIFILKNGSQMLVACTPIAGADSEFINVYNGAQILLSISVMILSTTMAKILIRRLKAIDSIGDRRQMRRHLDVATCKTICTIAIVYLFTWILSTICHNVLGRVMAPVQYLIYYPYCATFSVTYPATHVFVYISMSRVFRESYLRVIFRKSADSKSALVFASGTHS